MRTITYATLAALALSLSPPASAQNNELPDGPGKQILMDACSGCHEVGRTVRGNYTPDEWRNVVAMMVNFGAPVPQDKVEVLADYLIKSFPERPRPAAKIIPGPVEATIKEWDVPTPGSRPHDPLATPDGAIWYSGQMANVLGRLDPASGVIREYKLPQPQSGPHGLINDKAGRIWFTANAGGYIGRLDPATGDVAAFPMPDANIRDPHTLQFDQQGIGWFTAQNGNIVGRIDPASGTVKIVPSPTKDSRPYGLVISSKGVPFFDEFGSNKIGRIDPATMAIREYTLPDRASRPRRIAKTSDDVIWYSDYAQGRIGRLDPATGAVTEYASPSGPKSQPYAMTSLDDAIWYVESGAKPNALVRFDPKTLSFQSWPIPSGGGVVRNMVPTANGNLAIACSAVNKIGLVTIKR